MPECMLGYMPDGGSTHYFPRLFHNNKELGMYLALSGTRILG